MEIKSESASIGICPNCTNWISKFASPIPYDETKTKYCPICGIKVKWGGKNEG